MEERRIDKGDSNLFVRPRPILVKYLLVLPVAADVITELESTLYETLAYDLIESSSFSIFDITDSTSTVALPSLSKSVGS